MYGLRMDGNQRLQILILQISQSSPINDLGEEVESRYMLATTFAPLKSLLQVTTNLKLSGFTSGHIIYQDPFLELLLGLFTSLLVGNLLLVDVYLTTSQYLSTLLLQKYTNSGIVLVGDFNHWNSEIICKMFKIKQIIDFPTFMNPDGECATLDLIMTNLTQFYRKPTESPPLGQSRHKSIFLTPMPVHQMAVKSKITKVTRPLTSEGMNELRDLLHKEDWSDVLNSKSIDTKDKVFHKIMFGLIHKCFPQKTTQVCTNDKPWFSPELRHLIKIRDKLFKQNDPKWKIYRHKVRMKIKSDRLNFRNNFSQKLGQLTSRSWYGLVKKLTGASSRSILTIAEGIDNNSSLEGDPYTILNRVNDHFASITNSKSSSVPVSIPCYLPSHLPPIEVSHIEVYKKLTALDPCKSNSSQAVPSKILKECAIELCYILSHLLNSSFESGDLPASWKDGFITAIPKTPSVTSYSQLRPITVTSNLAKIAEQFIYEDIYEKISSQISVQQFGVLKKSSTAHYLIQLFDFLLKSIDKKPSQVIISLLDCEKAFDLINHNILINRLIKMGINENSIRWIQSFLTNRKNCLREHGLFSSFQPMTRGLPQGTLLGPLCFIVTFDPLLQRLMALTP